MDEVDELKAEVKRLKAANAALLEVILALATNDRAPLPAAPYPAPAPFVWPAWPAWPVPPVITFATGVVSMLADETGATGATSKCEAG